MTLVIEAKVPDVSKPISPMMLETDVLVVGGGVAGCCAAMGAAEHGARTMILEKYHAFSSGDAGAGEDHFVAILDEYPWDNPREFYEDHRRGKLDNENPALHVKYAHDLGGWTRRLEKMGMPFKDSKTGKYLRVQALGRTKPFTIQWEGSRFKRILASGAKQAGAKMMDRVMATSLLLDQKGRVVGATGLNTRTGEFYVVRAKAVAVSTGEACRLYESPDGNPFNSWHSPYNTGDGIVMCYKAGAVVGNMEFLIITLCPKGFSTPGTHAYMGAGCYLVNAEGERFMLKYHPQAEKAPRVALIRGIYREMKEGRGPCFIDARHLPKDELDRLVETLSVDKVTFGDYLSQMGIDLAKDPMEVGLSEFHEYWGMLIDENCATSVPGLFAAGEGTGSAGVSESSVEGYRAGKVAAEFASGIKEFQDFDRAQIGREIDRVYGILRRPNGPRYTALESEVRSIVTKYAHLDRTEESLKRALEKLNALRSLAGELGAQNVHDMFRVLEAQHILQVAILMVTCALQRKESRGKGGLMHFRGDYPETDPQWAHRMVTLRKVGDEAVVNIVETPKDVDIRV